MAAITQIKERASSRADRAAFQAKLIEIYRTKMLAVAAVLPLDFKRKFCLTFEIQLAKYVTSILTLDGALPRSEESSFVFGTEYSHFRCSL